MVQRRLGRASLTAQQASIPVVGFLRVTSAVDATNLVTAFRQGLKEAGFVAGQNVAIEYRWADGHIDRLPELTADLIRQVAVIVSHGQVVQLAKAATTTTPIVSVTGDDPVKVGIVANLNRPGGNVTGVTFVATDVAAKRLALLHELVPQAAVIAVLLDPNLPDADGELRSVEAASRTIGVRVLVVKASTSPELDTAFAKITQAGAGAVHVGSGPFFTTQRQRLALLSARHGLPSSYSEREYVAAGGLGRNADRHRAEIREALVAAGFDSTAKQAAALGVCRATAWVLLNRDKRVGPTASVLRRILSSANLPQTARQKVQEYVEERSAVCMSIATRGCFAHKFMTTRGYQ